MKKVMLALVVLASVGTGLFAGSQTKASAATYSTNRYIYRLPGAGCGQHDIQD